MLVWFSSHLVRDTIVFYKRYTSYIAHIDQQFLHCHLVVIKISIKLSENTQNYIQRDRGEQNGKCSYKNHESATELAQCSRSEATKMHQTLNKYPKIQTINRNNTKQKLNKNIPSHSELPLYSPQSSFYSLKSSL